MYKRKEIKLKYFNQKCTHCNKLFEKDDDVVVCPVCGTPQHRECYEENNQCINHDKHAEGYVWSAQDTSKINSENPENTDSAPEFIICSNCGTRNSGDSFFCKHCSTPLGAQSQGDFGNQNFQDNPNFQGTPFSATTFRINLDDEIAPDVKISEAQKYVKSNSLFFSLIFKRIHDHNRSRFNFSAFLFSGGWFLYRKQYLLGTILTILFSIFTITYNILYTPVYTLLEYYSVVTDSGFSYERFATLSNEQIILCFIWAFAYFAKFALMIISGLIANRCYYKHVIKKVRLAKKEFETQDELNEHLGKKGGTNLKLAYVLMILYAVVSFIPMIM